MLQRTRRSCRSSFGARDPEATCGHSEPCDRHEYLLKLVRPLLPVLGPSAGCKYVECLVAARTALCNLRGNWPTVSKREDEMKPIFAVALLATALGAGAAYAQEFKNEATPLFDNCGDPSY